jgi:transglutaminase-like putative cysteine protease
MALTGCMKFVTEWTSIVYEDGDENYTEYSTEKVETNTTVVESLQASSVAYFEGKSYLRYDQLNDVQKNGYCDIYEGIKNYSSTINLTDTITEDDLNLIYDAIINTADFELVCPTRKYDYKYDSFSGEVYSVSPSYEVSSDVRDTMIQRVDTVADEIIAQTVGLDEFQTVRFFHDYIILNCSYDDSEDTCGDAYGALVQGKAVCEGYARAFKYLCDKVGIPCELVNGYADVEHMWNVVSINGEWYQLDATWDDPKNKDGDYISYTYFNITTEEMLKDHTIDDTLELPDATATTYNYFNYYDLNVTSLEDFHEKLYQKSYYALENGRKYVYFRATDESVYDDILQNLVKESDMYSIINNANNDVGTGIELGEIYYSHDDIFLTFNIDLNY